MSAQAIVEQARRWIGTPFHHQAAQRGLGCDCLGLIRGVWHALGGIVPSEEMDYASHWGHQPGPNRFYIGLARYLDPIDIAELEHGDVVLCSLRLGGPLEHAGFVATDQDERRIIHAHTDHGVIEEAFDPIWARLSKAAFRFPNKR